MLAIFHSKNLSWKVLLLILVLASFLRLYNLDSVPASIDWDEASLGYNAYSIMQTGRDEYGKLFPVVLQSFGDYKPALYSYLTIPSVWIFGLTPFSVRLPSALFGVLAVFGAYLLIFELFKRKDIALLSALLLAISPWHIQFSHAAFEASVAITFNIFTAYFFIKGLKKHWYLLPSVLCAVGSMYLYQSEKVFSPLFFLLLMLVYAKELLRISWKFLILCAGIGVLFCLPLLFFFVSNQHALTRIQTVNVFSDTRQMLQANILQLNDDFKNHDALGFVLDNRRYVFFRTLLDNYLAHFNLNWLFITGDKIPRHQAYETAHLYIWDIPFLFIGIYTLLFGKFSKKTKYLLFFWFLLAPIPAAITIEVPHAIRTLNFLPTFQIFIALGVITVYEFVKKSARWKSQAVIFSTIALVLVFNFAYFFDQYFIQYNYFNSQDWQYGYSQIIPYVKSHYNDYDRIIVSNKIPLDQSYIFFLFYLKYPLQKFQTEERHSIEGYQYLHDFGKFAFHPINDWNKEKQSKNTLFVVGFNEVPLSEHSVKDIYFLNGQPAMRMIAN